VTNLGVTLHPPSEERDLILEAFGDAR